MNDISEGKILIISLQGLGNTAMLTPILKYLNEQKKNKISLILSNNGPYQYIKALNFKSIDKIYIWREEVGDIRNILHLVRLLKQDKFTIAYATHPAGKRENLLLFLSRAYRKLSLIYPNGYFSLLSFLNRGKIADRNLHDIENNSILFNIPYPQISKKLDFNNKEITIAIHVGAKELSKRWDIYRYSNLIKLLKSDFKCKFILIAGKDERYLVEVLRNNCSNNIKLEVLIDSGFPELISKIISTDIVLGNDSSILHIAAVLGIPTIAIWSFAQFWRISPYGVGSIVIKKDYSCIPCYDFTKKYISDCQYHLRCIKDIKVEEVYTIVKMYILSLQSQRIPLVDDFKEIKFLSEIKSLRNGCLILSLKGNNN